MTPIMSLSLEDIIAYAKNCFLTARGSHDWDHTERVYRLCMHIGEVEGADLEVLAVAAYLHDIGRPDEDESKGAICHAEKGAEVAKALLAQYPFSDKRKCNIVHCVGSHRFRGNHVPETLEAMTLFDSDKLDSIGAIGIGRAFLFAGEVGARLHNPEADLQNTRAYTADDTGYREFRLKLSKIRERMLTAEGTRLAEARHAFTEQFFERLQQEYEGKK
jgi:uncharacterized protein